MLSAWERKVSGKVCEPVTERVVLRIRTDKELREMYKTSDLVSTFSPANSHYTSCSIPVSILSSVLFNLDTESVVKQRV
jgi:hypothetical protein